MDERKFWNIIKSAREKADAWNMRLLGGALVEILIDQPKSEILEYDHIFDTLMDKAYQAVLWDAADIIVCGCSDDGFIDFRAWLITQGQRIYEDALENPDSLSAVIPAQMRYATLNGLLAAVAWDAYKHKTQQQIPNRRYKMPKLKGQRMEWDERKSSFPLLLSALGECSQLFQNVKLAHPSGRYGIFEFADETYGGRWYVGGSTSVTLATRLEQHRLKGRFSDWDKVVWSTIAKPEFIDIAERVRAEQIASIEKDRSKSANICMSVTYNPASDERVKHFFENKIWKQIEDWPKWLYPPEEYCNRIGLLQKYTDLS
jgi:hypothetical protein